LGIDIDDCLGFERFNKATLLELQFEIEQIEQKELNNLT